MARSTRNTAQRKTVREEVPYHTERAIKNYYFEYQRDRVSRRAGSSYFSIEPAGGGLPIQMTLQEAQSLYNFLSKALNS